MEKYLFLVYLIISIVTGVCIYFSSSYFPNSVIVGIFAVVMMYVAYVLGRIRERKNLNALSSFILPDFLRHFFDTNISFFRRTKASLEQKRIAGIFNGLKRVLESGELAQKDMLLLQAALTSLLEVINFKLKHVLEVEDKK